MKFNQFTKLFAIVVVLATSACKKYGYNITDGYPDNSQNVKGGDLDTNLKVIDKSMYGKAKVFPGLVDQSEPRVKDEKFTLDLNFTTQTADNLRISVAPEAQFSTGYYAAPGELIKIVVPAGIDGLVMQIGGHTDDLSGKLPLLRDPVVYMRQQLFAGVNYVRNLYGGTIYIRSTFSYPNPVEFTITNACKSPDFILDQMSDADWVAKVKASQVPWLELRAKRVIFLIPRDKVIATFGTTTPFNNPTAVMKNWNEVFDLDYNGWMGLSDNALDPRDKSPQGAWRGVLDIQLSLGYGHSGFPFVGLNDGYWFGTFTTLNLQGAWGTYHEFGHNCQQTTVWSWSTLGETTNNLFNFKVANRRGTDYTLLHRAVVSGFPLAITYASTPAATGTTKDFDKDLAMNDPFKRMTPFIQLFEVYGYDLMTYLYVQARHADRLSPSDITKHNFVYEKLSDKTGIDLYPFFRAWGITLSTAVLNKVGAKYPTLTKDVWTYNPFTRLGGTTTIDPTVYSATGTSVAANDFTKAVDNVATTYWEASGGFPYLMNVDNVAKKTIKAMSFQQRSETGATSSNSGRVKDIEVFYSNDNANFTSIGTYQIPDAAVTVNTYTFPVPVTARYFQVQVKSNWRNTAVASLSEFKIIQ